VLAFFLGGGANYSFGGLIPLAPVASFLIIEMDRERNLVS